MEGDGGGTAMGKRDRSRGRGAESLLRRRIRVEGTKGVGHRGLGWDLRLREVHMGRKQVVGNEQIWFQGVGLKAFGTSIPTPSCRLLIFDIYPRARESPK